MKMFPVLESNTLNQLSDYERNQQLLSYCSTSVITAVLYSPDPCFRKTSHIAVALDGRPFIFCGELDSSSANRHAEQLANSQALLHVVRKLGLGRELSLAEIGENYGFDQACPAVVGKPSGGEKEEQGDGGLIVFFSNHISPQIVQLLCIDDEIGSLLASREWVPTGFNLLDHLLCAARSNA